MNIRGGVLVLALLAVPVAQSPAQDVVPTTAELEHEDRALRQRLGKRLAELEGNTPRLVDAMEAGRLRSRLCSQCHGVDGNSVREGVPNLAGQNPVYLVDQFQRYADGRRYDFWMSSLSARFSDEDKLNLAIYYAKQKTIPAGGGATHLVERGRDLYARHCAECHGADGRSTRGYARLAGQRPEYLVRMLDEFRKPDGRRSNPLMYARARLLRTPEDTRAVAAYLASLD